ncbi:O-antigen ligase family protein [Parasedimentitalea psychrophila]|uniref:O-antigen ligase domain-containing protein n=1 Tax=Parasedimentitalea psychrophila TaxID=2997337 RepID=A0A9Y2L1L6_9RHOB|nr:O-antigen ligase domain-containing protein [Parasedimentitalea psychrophila]WIY26001.1 O-antigen ligase domain-containing protein [Parasedimentitalea psychrophila]
MSDISPQNPAEKIAYKALVWTWPFYAIGALYIVGPVLGWMLGALAILVAYIGPAARKDLRATTAIPPVVWAWMIGMLAMLIILWIGLLNFDFGTKPIIRSTIGWAKGWALMALFPLAGAVLPIRRAILVRGQCVVGLWILILAPLMLAAPYIGLPERIFVSPLKAVGGPGPEYFTVFLFTFDPSSGAPRWQFYAPWSPFAALLGVIMVLFALEDGNRRWKTIGLLAGVILILASKSRMGLVGVVVCPAIPRLLRLSAKSWAWQGLAGCLVVASMIADGLITSAQSSIHAFKSARSDSTRVRATLQRIATERWQGEAFWFGHGRVAPGSHIVEYMPIGSHHTWYGLLFVKGVAGFLALLLPFIWQFWLAASDTVRSDRGRLPLGIMLVFLLLSFGENIEIEVYLLWPCLLLMGIHAKELTSPPN